MIPKVIEEYIIKNRNRDIGNKSSRLVIESELGISLEKFINYLFKYNKLNKKK